MSFPQTDSHTAWDAWAELYDLEHDQWSTQDLPFYLAEARANPPVLELACGTGRLTVPIAQAGIEITGLDFASPMLERASAKAGPIPHLRLVQGNMEDFTLEQRFGLIFICYSGFLVLPTVEAQERTLRTIRRHLRPGGRLIMDMFVPNADELGVASTTGEGATMRLVRQMSVPAIGHTILIWEAAAHIQNEQTFHVHRVTQAFDSAGKPTRDMQHSYVTGRYVYRFEMQHLLRMCGFRIAALYSGFNREPFDATSTRMIWVATADT